MGGTGNDHFNAGMRDSRRHLLGYACYLAGLVLALLGAGALFGLFDSDQLLLAIGTFTGAILIAILLLAMAEGFLVPSVREVCARDPRPPVLYLRPFGEDKELVYDVISSGESSTTLSAKAEDFLLALNAVGPLVSIAEPDWAARMGMHPHGAFRDFVGSGDWQGRVVELLDQAGMVVLAIGDSPGIEWEIARVRERIGPESLLLYLPPRPASAWTRRGRTEKERAIYDGFCPLVERHFGLRMPEFSAATYIIGFDRTGEPLLAPDAPRGRWVFTEHARVSGAITAQLKVVLGKVRPEVDLDHYRIAGRAAMVGRLSLAAVSALAVILLALLSGAAGLGATAEIAGSLLIQALPGLALLLGWVLLARHFGRRWAWSIPLLLGLTLLLNSGINAALLLDWWDGDKLAVEQWQLLGYALNSVYALAVLALGLVLARAPAVAGRPGR